MTMTGREALAFELHHRNRYLETLEHETRERKQPAGPLEKRRREHDAFWREQERLLGFTAGSGQDAVDRAANDELDELLDGPNEHAELFGFWHGQLDDNGRR